MVMVSKNQYSRRKFLATSSTLGLVAVAGCTSNNQLSGSTTSEDHSGPDHHEDHSSPDHHEELAGEINIAGSSTVFPLMGAMAEDFQKAHPDVTITIQSTGSGGGFKNFFCVGQTHFSNASRPIKDSEVDLCKGNGVTPHEIRLATDALTVVVNKNADWIESLTVAELKSIWDQNAAEKWSDVNPAWPDKKIDRYGAADTSGTFDYFNEVIIGEDGDTHTTDYQPTEEDHIIVTGVEGSEYAIGYFGFSYYYNNPDSIKALKIDGGNGPIAPTLDTAKNGSYGPLSRPLFTYVSVDALAEEHVADFAKFCIEQSANETLVAEQVGYVPNTKEAMNKEMAALEALL
ncbi:MAG TPA: PstS family phosphate ABC transporter substrate-binding protein [Halobacteriales archaeon]|nr:PstS family phosphate ABC transporter substrate-binding protein [Halobacteriales archaeon]